MDSKKDKYKPFGDRVIVKQLKHKDDTNRMTVTPDNVYIEERAVGEVVSSNCDDVKMGDKVVFEEFAGALIPGEDGLIILNIDDILAIKYE